MRLSVRIPLIFSFLAFAPLLAFGYLAVDQGRQALERHARHEREIVAATAVAQIEVWLDDARRELEAWAADADVVRLAQAAWSREAPYVYGSLRVVADWVRGTEGVAPRWKEVSLLDGDSGRVLLTTSRDGEEGPGLTHRDLVGARSGTVVSGIRADRSDAGAVLLMATPVQDESRRTLAVLVGDLDLARLSRALAAGRVGTDTGEAYVVDATGSVVTPRRGTSASRPAPAAETVATVACRDAGRFGGIYAGDLGSTVVGYALWVPILGGCLVSEIERAEAIAPLKRLRQIVWGAGAGTLLVSALLGVAFASTLVRPLRGLREGAAALTEHGGGTRIPVRSRDEFGLLAREFNRLADAVAERQAALEATIRELEESKAQTEAASAAKTEFLSRMSHELRTPMNVILGFAQILELESVTPEQENAVRDIIKAGSHLLGLINEILDLSRIEAGRLQLSLEPVLVKEVAEDALELIRPLAEGSRVRLELALADREAAVRADRQRMRQVLLNLLANAVKYNRPGGRVRLRCVGAGEKCRILVADGGRGIPRARMAQLFQPFERLGAEADRTTEGTGLGLAVSRGLVEAMGGRIGARSIERLGSVFWVELPAAPLQPPGAAEPPAVSRDVAVRSSQGERRKVLLIEDNLANVGLIEALVKRRPNTELLTAMQGRIGLALAAEHLPDLVILDLHLPDMRGEEVLAQLRADPRTRGIPVVVASADAMESTVRRLTAAGALRFLAKPFDVRELLRLIEGASRRSGV